MKNRFAIGSPHVASACVAKAAERWRVESKASTIWRRCLALLGLAFMFSHSPLARGQDDLFKNPSISAGTPTLGSFDSNLHITENPDPIAKSFRQSKEKLARLKSKLKEALALKDDEIILNTKEEVKNALHEQLAHDFALQESQLSRLIKRTENAAALNKQRLAAKDELIELQLQSYVIEKDSIGSSDRDVELRNLFGTRRQTAAPSLVPIATEKPDNNGLDDLAFSFEPPAVRTSADPKLDDSPLVQQNRTTTIEAARMKLARASSEEEEARAKKELENALVAYFDRDLEERNRLLKTVCADIEKMQRKLEKRVSSKNSIVELQFKMFVNEASGLGFFSPSATTNDPERIPDPNDLRDPFFSR